MIKWYEKSGAQGDAVISTRLRLARNIREYPFPAKLNADQRQKVEQAVKDAVMNCVDSIDKNFRFLNMEDLSQTEAVSLVERHLVSPEFISDRKGRGLIFISSRPLSGMNRAIPPYARATPLARAAAMTASATARATPLSNAEGMMLVSDSASAGM